MSPTTITPPTDEPGALVERLRATTEALESIAANRNLLDVLSDADRRRFLRALTTARGPASRSRRRLAKATAREERAARVGRIVGSAPKPCPHPSPASRVHHAQLFPPVGFDPRSLGVGFGSWDCAQRDSASHDLYIGKAKYSTIPHFTTSSALSAQAELRQAHRAFRPSRTSALITGGRVKIGYGGLSCCVLARI